MAAYRHAVSLDPNNGQARCRLGKAYLKMGNKDLALEEYEVVKTLDEELADALYELID